jgi:hypothetical protein
VIGGTPIPVEIELQATMAVPPWIQGEMNSTAEGLLETGIEGLFVGGARYEQLCRVAGTFKIGSEPSIDFTGTALRVHRVGVRNVAEFWGHCWQSALFPSGKAFGYICFPPRRDASPSYNEGYIFDGEELIAARVTRAPWMTTFRSTGDDVSLTLETKHGEVTIQGESHTSTFHAPGTFPFGEWQAGVSEHALALPFHQGGARYEWDGEVAYGMIERSLPPEQVAVTNARAWSVR